MAMHGKKYRSAKEKISPDKNYSLAESLAKIKELAYVKFDESVETLAEAGSVIMGTVLLRPLLAACLTSEAAVVPVDLRPLFFFSAGISGVN